MTRRPRRVHFVQVDPRHGDGWAECGAFVRDQAYIFDNEVPGRDRITCRACLRVMAKQDRESEKRMNRKAGRNPVGGKVTDAVVMGAGFAAGTFAFNAAVQSTSRAHQYSGGGKAQLEEVNANPANPQPPRSRETTLHGITAPVHRTIKGVGWRLDSTANNWDDARKQAGVLRAQGIVTRIFKARPTGYTRYVLDDDQGDNRSGSGRSANPAGHAGPVCPSCGGLIGKVETNPGYCSGCGAQLQIGNPTSPVPWHATHRSDYTIGSEADGRPWTVGTRSIKGWPQQVVMFAPTEADAVRRVQALIKEYKP